MKSQQISKNILHNAVAYIVKEIRVDLNFADRIYQRRIW